MKTTQALRLPAIEQPFGDAEKSADASWVGPVGRIQVRLSRPATHAVFVATVGIGREAFILERGVDRAERAVGHQIAEDAARRAPYEIGHRVALCVDVPVVRPPARATAR